MAAERIARAGAAPPARMVHLGVGAFFKAFLAPWTAEAGGWGIVGVSLRRPDERDRLAPQGFAYHAAEQGPGGPRLRRVEVLRDVLVAPDDPGAVLAAMADPAVRIVSLTVTEKGYCHVPATGALDEGHPDILHDLAHPGAPRSAPGVLVAALARRRAAGAEPFAVLSCDNLPSNGRVARAVVLDLAGRIDPGLRDWIAARGRFPSSMVDRIVPAATPADRDAVERLSGVRDEAAVVHEPFRQWAVEAFDDRPAWEDHGALVVADVAPFEAMKLRCLNGAHSALSYLGVLAGHATVAEAVADPALAGFLRALWREEVVPSLDPPPAVDLWAYTDALLLRFANPAIRHRTAQIATDGSQKLPQRLLAPALDGLRAGRPVPRLATAVAAWMRHAGGTDDLGRPVEVSDPLAARLRALRDGAGDPEGRARALLSVREVFPPALAADPRWAGAVAAALASLEARGARATAAALA